MLTPALGGAEPLLMLLFVIAFDAYLGDFRALAWWAGMPASLAERAAVSLDRKLNRIDRGDTARMIRGALVVLVLAAFAAAVGWAAARFARHAPGGWGLEFLLLLTGISLRRPWHRVREVGLALGAGGVVAGRSAVSLVTDRQVHTLDDHGVVRAAIEALAKASYQQAAAPAFWYVLFGLPGLMVWTTVNAVDGVIGHRSPRYAWFGRVAAALDDALGFLPARLAGLLIAGGSVFVPGTHPGGALAVMVRDAGKHRSRNGGWPEAAMAGALGLALGGPHREGEVVVHGEWIGAGRARAVPADIRRALGIFAVANLLLAGLVAALTVVVAGL